MANVLRRDQIRVRKPYDKILDRILKQGHIFMEGFGKTAPVMREAKRSKAFCVRPASKDRWLLFPNNTTMRLKKNHRKTRQSKYGIYEI